MRSAGVADWKTTRGGNTERTLTAAAPPPPRDPYRHSLAMRPPRKARPFRLISLSIVRANQRKKEVNSKFRRLRGWWCGGGGIGESEEPNHPREIYENPKEELRRIPWENPAVRSAVAANPENPPVKPSSEKLASCTAPQAPTLRTSGCANARKYDYKSSSLYAQSTKKRMPRVARDIRRLWLRRSALHIKSEEHSLVFDT